MLETREVPDVPEDDPLLTIRVPIRKVGVDPADYVVSCIESVDIVRDTARRDRIVAVNVSEVRRALEGGAKLVGWLRIAVWIAKRFGLPSWAVIVLVIAQGIANAIRVDGD